ncbi:hypothetical protein FHT44_005165 [Mycolicibacterium sp. BK634]|nr:hypothetical protein [Mycolicibacterium sp. BK634]
MTNPVNEAVERAWTDDDGGPAYYSSMTDAMKEAVHEALAPLRRLHTPGPVSQLSTSWMVGAKAECTTCRRDWPCSTARLIYDENELAR